MCARVSKAQLLNDLKNEQAQWEAFLAEMGEAHMTQPGVAGEWSIKDIVAHLTGVTAQTPHSPRHPQHSGLSPITPSSDSTYISPAPGRRNSLPPLPLPGLS